MHPQRTQEIITVLSSKANSAISTGTFSKLTGRRWLRHPAQEPLGGSCELSSVDGLGRPNWTWKGARQERRAVGVFVCGDDLLQNGLQ